MAEFDRLLWALDKEISPRDFERLCVDLLGREGYRHIIPVGGAKDHGRDAELRCWRGTADDRSVVVFQFSLQEAWERKLREDAETIAAHCPDTTAMVFVSSQAITGSKQDQLRSEFRARRGWDFTVYPREWLRHRLTELHQDLAKKYFSLDMPLTVGYAATVADLSDLGERTFTEAFRQMSPELVRATILESTRKEPSNIDNWYRLARIEFFLRNYSGALEAVNKAFQLKPQDPVMVVNMSIFRGGVLAELGVQDHSRPLLIEARKIFENSVKKLKRAVDHFNFANVLGALGETDEAGRQYLRCLKLKPDFAEAWKNFGSLFLQRGRHKWAVECFDKALHYKPKLVEAHLSRATALLLFFGRPEESIQCFELAYNSAPDLDRKWKYARYWFSKALLAAGRAEEALAQIERELLLRPGDVYLLNQKASALSTLRKQSPAYEQLMVNFLEFRAHAIPDNYAGLAELIDIFALRGYPERAWACIEASLVCRPFSLSEVAKEAQIPIADLQLGFQNARLYRVFRRMFSLEDHCVTLHGYGLFPRTVMLPAASYALMAPFGALAREIRRARESNRTPEFQVLFTATVDTVSRLFPVFGPHWLARTKPDSLNKQAELLSIGILYMIDIVVAETARLIGFIAGYYEFPDGVVRQAQRADWTELRTEIGVRLTEHVLKDWEMS